MKYILILIIAIFSHNLQSKDMNNNLKCKVIDSNTKEILIGCKIKILNDSIVHYTDLNGLLVINNIKNYNIIDAIIVDYTSYDSKVVNYNLKLDTFIIVELDKARIYVKK